MPGEVTDVLPPQSDGGRRSCERELEELGKVVVHEATGSALVNENVSRARTDLALEDHEF